MRPSSEKRLQKLHPALILKLRSVVSDLAAQGITVEIVQGLRTFEEQDALYAQGRTRPGAIVTQARGGESNHNYGLAADLCPFVDGKLAWNAPFQVWAAIGDASARHGLEWGGTWKKFLDKPHVELPSMPVKDCVACFRSGGIEAVWSIASKKIGWTAPADAAFVGTPVGGRSLGVRKNGTRGIATRSAAAMTVAGRKRRRRKSVRSRPVREN